MDMKKYLNEDLAALNICDEYFKLLDTAEPSNNLSELLLKNKQLQTELSDLRKDESNSSRVIEDLKEEAQLAEKFEALYNGEIINTGEKRHVLHQLTRGQLGNDVMADGVNKREFYVKQQGRPIAFCA